MDDNTGWDVIVIGGSPAGLSGATVLARARRSVLVLDAGEPRNSPAEAVHSFLTRDGMPPRELLAAGRVELESYGGQVHQAAVISARRVHRGFEVALDDGSTCTARRLLVTTGLVDELPEIEGLRAHWGTHVVHCPYCHGWEVRDQPLAVIASGPMAGHQTLLFTQLSDDITLLLNGQADLPEEEAAKLAALGVTTVQGAVTRVLSDDHGVTGVEVGGRIVPCTAVVVGPEMVARSEILASLGIATEDLVLAGVAVATYVPSDPVTGMTAVSGVYVAGNVTDPQAQVITAAGAAVKAAAMLNMDLIQEDATRALTAVG